MPKRRQKTRAYMTGTEPTLARVLEQSEEVEEKVGAAAIDLSDVNRVLSREVHNGTPLDKVVGALGQSVGAEIKLQEAADELVAVNDALSTEIDDRIAIQHRLLQSEKELAVSRIQERRAHHKSLHDPVTGLPNATLFKDRLESALAQSERHHWQLAVMFLDLNGFKAVNDTHGHDLGDAVLCLVADRLQEFVRAGDTVSRRSGDEFLYLMPEAGDVENARRMADRIIALISAPCVIDGVSLCVQASIGLAMFPADGTTPSALLKHADLAMYEAKRHPAGTAPQLNGS